MNTPPPSARARRLRTCDDPSPRWLLSTPSWAVALALHLFAAVILMNIVDYVPAPGASQVFRISLAPPRPMEPPGGAAQGDQDNGIDGNASEDSPPAGAIDPADPAPRGVGMPESAGTAPALSLAPAALAPSGAAGATPSPGTGTSGALGTGGLFSGRGGAGRGELLRRNGGSADTERAVVDGLDWLARHQMPDGSWGTGAGTCRVAPACDPAPATEAVAATSFALLAFAGHGITHKDGKEQPHAAVVDRGVKCLLKAQTSCGFFGSPELPGWGLYSQAAATMAMAELLGMTQDPRLRTPVRKAVEFLVDSQQPCGGWDYNAGPTGRGDTSISAMVVQALRSARAAGIPLPRQTWESTRKFFNGVFQASEGRFTYQVNPGGWAGVRGGFQSLAAAGGTARQYLELTAAPRVEDLLATNVFSGYGVFEAEANIREHPAYFTYYATLYAFRLGGERWTSWNRRLQAALLPAQVRAGCARGSWNPEGTDLTGYGRALMTALSVLSLEVYYRYLPSSSGSMARLVDSPGQETVSLLARLQDPDMKARREAADRLSERDEEGVFEALFAAARQERTSLREVMIRRLEKFGESPERRELMESLLSEKERDGTRLEARRVLDAWEARK